MALVNNIKSDKLICLLEQKQKSLQSFILEQKEIEENLQGMAQEYPEWITKLEYDITQISEYVGIHRNTIRKRIVSKNLKHKYKNNRLIVSFSVANQLINYYNGKYNGKNRKSDK